MEMRSIFLVIVIVFISIISSNCCSIPDPYYNSTEYTYTHQAAKNVTIDLVAGALGDTPIKIMESNSSNISIIIMYCWKPEKVNFTDNGEDLNVNVRVVAPTDHIGLGAEIFFYLPNNATYNFKIENHAAYDTSAYREHSKTTVGEFKGPIKIIINDQIMVDK